jgi:hypothetical protein
MNETKPRTAEGKVLWHFTMSLDGFVAGQNHAMGERLGRRLQTTSGGAPC